MQEKIKNRMTADWQPASVVQVQVRAICCPKCASPRTATRNTQPEEGKRQMRCNKCGNVFAVRNYDTASPEVRPVASQLAKPPAKS